MIRLYWIMLLLMMAVATHGQMDSTVINLKNGVVTGKAGFITGENICIDGGMTHQMIYHGDNGWTLRLSPL